MENRILLKARDLMTRNGVKHVTMDDLASQLGISKKTIYQFYKDKDTLVTAVINFELEEQALKCQRTQEIAENAVHEMFMILEDIQQLFKNMNPMTLNELQKYYPAAFNRIQSYKNDFMLRLIKANLVKGIKEGVYRKEIDPEILAIYRLETGLVPFNPDLYPFSKFDIGKVTLQIIENFVYGVMSLAGIKLMEQYKEQVAKTRQLEGDIDSEENIEIKINKSN
jgi:AcrR family transcriptional regulator